MDETMDEDAAGPSRECANLWPHLTRLFQFSEQVNDSFRFKCLPKQNFKCLPKQNFITAYKNSSSNLRKHFKRRHETHLEEYCQLTSTACKRPSEGGTGFKAKQLKLLEAKQVSEKMVDRAILRFIVQELVAEGTIEEEEEVGEDCDASDGEEEVEFMDVEAILEEDDGLQYQLPRHHRCACHLLNFVSTVDVDRANKTEAYKKLSRSAFSKCQALWNKASRSPQNAELIEEHCKLHLVQPNSTRWNSSFMAVERVVRIIRDQGEGSVRTVCAALNVPM
ncbi:hypothetical protein QQF64_004533 [Cirrhinus molitorella]|uniref:Transposase n=1 Tax=Cirrhinus molitorella TaxID=172907 RepID=A0ABR3MGG1_9TELE